MELKMHIQIKDEVDHSGRRQVRALSVRGSEVGLGYLLVRDT